MEIEADKFAARVLFRSSGSHMLITKQFAQQKSIGFIASFQLFAIFIAQTAFAILDTVLVKQMRVDDALAIATDYPASGARAFFGFMEYGSSLRHACQVEANEFYLSETEHEVLTRCSALIGRVTRVFSEFSFYGNGLAHHEDALLGATAEHKECDELRRFCSDHAFL